MLEKLPASQRKNAYNYFVMERNKNTVKSLTSTSSQTLLEFVSDCLLSMNEISLSVILPKAKVVRPEELILDPQNQLFQKLLRSIPLSQLSVALSVAPRDSTRVLGALLNNAQLPPNCLEVYILEAPLIYSFIFIDRAGESKASSGDLFNYSTSYTVQDDEEALITEEVRLDFNEDLTLDTSNTNRFAQYIQRPIKIETQSCLFWMKTTSKARKDDASMTKSFTRLKATRAQNFLNYLKRVESFLIEYFPQSLSAQLLTAKMSSLAAAKSLETL